MSKIGRINYIVNERISHNVDNEYVIVFDRCTQKLMEKNWIMKNC